MAYLETTMMQAQSFPNELLTVIKKAACDQRPDVTQFDHSDFSREGSTSHLKDAFDQI